MEESIKIIAVAIISMFLLILGFDYAQIGRIGYMAKDSLDLSTKAAALQIDKDKEKLGKGIFELDTEKAKQENERVFNLNMPKNIQDYELKTDIVNAHTDIIYTSSNGHEFNIDEPTIFANVKIKYKGIFLHKTIEKTVVSGSSLRNINDLK